MRYNRVLITGASGKLGSALLDTKPQDKIYLAPKREELDITDSVQTSRFFQNNSIDIVIHCAALTNLPECEINPSLAIKTNIIGTSNLAAEAAKRDNVRFIYISTDYVYPGKKGPYSENDPTIPFTVYGSTKLGGELAVRSLKNYCIIRTSFFDPNKIPFDSSPNDAYCSKIPLSSLVEAINLLVDSNFTGIVNVGQERESIFNILKKYKPSLKATTLEDVSKGQKIKRAKDSSLDINLWNKIKNT